MNTAGPPRSLTFNWDQVRRFTFVLPGFLLISLIGHLGTFFLFQVAYPRQASITAPHPSFTILDPRRPDHQALLRWIDAEDPAPASSGASNVAERLLDVTYRPSFATMRTQPLPVPAPPQTVLFPPARDPLAIIRSGEEKAPPPPPPPPAKPTRIVFSPELLPRLPDTLPRFKVSSRVSKPIDSAEFLIGVTDRGEIRFIFKQRTSADPVLDPEAAALDDQAADQLSRVKLKPQATELTWGRARIEWGPEIYSDTSETSSPGTNTRP